MPSTEDPKPPKSVDISKPKQPKAEIALQNVPNAKNNPEAASDHASKGATQNNTKTQNNVPTEVQEAKEYGGPAGLEPTRYGDWEKNGRCTDF